MINENLVRKYCKEDISKIKNYDLAIADKTQTWQCHHMTETWWHCTAKDLIDNECYYHRKACELIFLTEAEHKSLHMKGENNHNFGKHHSEETRKKLSEALKGKSSPLKGVKLSEEARRNMSEAHKGKTLTEEHRRKIAEAKKNMSEETRLKMSEAQKRRWAATKKI